MTKLLCDPIGFQYRLVESAGALPIVRGIFQKYDIPNANNRVYRKAIWEKQLKQNSPLTKRVGSRQCLGLLEHPDDGFTRLDRSPSHLIIRLEDDGKGHIIGEAQILKTRNGQELLALFRDNVKLGVSSRGNGSTTEGKDGHDDVNDDYMCETFDFVFNNSVEDANPEPINLEAFGESKKTEKNPDPNEETKVIPVPAKKSNESTPAKPTDSAKSGESDDKSKSIGESINVIKEVQMSKLGELKQIEADLVHMGRVIKSDITASERAVIVESLRMRRVDLDKAVSEDKTVEHYAADLQKKIDAVIASGDASEAAKVSESENQIKNLKESNDQLAKKLQISEQIVQKLVERYKALKTEVSAGSKPDGKNESQAEVGKKWKARYETLRKMTEEIIRRYKSLKTMSEASKTKVGDAEKKAVHESKRYQVSKKIIEGLVKRFKALNESINGKPAADPAKPAAPAPKVDEGKKPEAAKPVAEAVKPVVPAKEPLPGQAPAAAPAKPEMHEAVGMLKRARKHLIG